MEFEEKPEIKELVQDDKLDKAIVEQDLAPALHAQFDEPDHGPVPEIVPEIPQAPHASALAAWIDDIEDYTDAHRGDPKASELMDKLASGALDDVLGTARGHLKEDITADMEQKGMVNDFHADSAIEGAALDTHKPEEQKEAHSDDAMPLRNRKAGLGDGDDDDGGGGGGGGGAPGAPPSDGGSGEPGDPKDPKKKKEAADAKAADKDKPRPDKPADKPAPGDKAKRDDKKRDGDR